MENIVIQDLNKVYKFIKNIFIYLMISSPFLFRIMICLMISSISIRALGIKETIVLNGWINIQLLIGMVIWEIILALYIKAYNMEKANKKDLKNKLKWAKRRQKIGRENG